MDLLDKILGWAIPALCGSVVGSFVFSITLLKSIKTGVQCLLRAEIISQHEKWEARGFCPIYAKEALTRAYKSYHNLGGNDVATALYEQTIRLPEEKSNGIRSDTI